MHALLALQRSQVGTGNSLRKFFNGHGGIPKALKNHPKRERPMVFRDLTCQNLDEKTTIFLLVLII